MSNPGVIVIVNERNVGPKITRLDIEDNIGECIHIHLNNFRFDFTIEEFLRLSSDLKEHFNALLDSKKFRLDRYDSRFLFEIKKLIPSIRGVESCYFKLNELKFVETEKFIGIKFNRLKNINQTKIYKHLKYGEEYKSYEQFNLPGIDNEKRVKNLREYNLNLNLVLFSGQKIIRDGRHRAALMAVQNGLDSIVKVDVFLFENSNSLIKERFLGLRSFMHSLKIKVLNRLRYIKYRWIEKKQ